MRYSGLTLFLLTTLLTTLMVTAQPDKPALEQTMFGQMPDGRPVHLYMLRNKSGMVAQITNYGGYLVSLQTPDRTGHLDPVTLGVPTFADYLAGTPAFGPIIGRFGNRIAGGRFTLDGQTYTLAVNNGVNHLHGGRVGFDKKLWTASVVSGKEPAIQLQYTSPDGEEGYPGTLNVTVTYTLQADNALRIDYRATTDKPTVLNLTNHAYFNLSGMKRDVLDHQLTLLADSYLPTDRSQIPTGERRPVAGTVFDFRQPTAIGARINDTTDLQIRNGFGYDHCWVFDNPTGELKKGAVVYDPLSGRTLELFTTEPAVQLYTGNHLNGKLKGKEDVAYTRRFGLCLETQHFPNSPNQPDFPTTTLRPGEVFKSTTVFKFGVR